MKKIAVFLISAVIALSACTAAFAAEAPLQDAPFLESIEFSNATIDGGFKQNKTFFSITLNDPSESAVLSKYKINGNAEVFITYNYDKSNHQTGIVVTLTFSSGSLIYTFNYSNSQNYAVSSNANLAALNCEYGEIQPEINSQDTVYRLYIPSDLTELNLTPVTQDINAYATALPITLREGQETEIPITVTASDGSTKKYTFKIKRVDKTTAEVKAEMAQEGFTSFVEGELFYQKPVFLISVCSAVGGLLVIALIILLIKRIAVSPYDDSEEEFFAP